MYSELVTRFIWRQRRRQQQTEHRRPRRRNTRQETQGSLLPLSSFSSQGAKFNIQHVVRVQLKQLWKSISVFKWHVNRRLWLTRQSRRQTRQSRLISLI
jgi:hypothetical protein